MVNFSVLLSNVGKAGPTLDKSTNISVGPQRQKHSNYLDKHSNQVKKHGNKLGNAGDIRRGSIDLPLVFTHRSPSPQSAPVLEHDAGMDIFWTPKSEMCPKCVQNVPKMCRKSKYVQNVTKTCLKVHNVSKMHPTWLKVWSHFGHVFEK